MTLAELKEAIDWVYENASEEEKSREVFTEYDYGDRCHTRALNNIYELVEAHARKSAYSDSGFAVADECEEEESTPIFLLS